MGGEHDAIQVVRFFYRDIYLYKLSTTDFMKWWIRSGMKGQSHNYDLWHKHQTTSLSMKREWKKKTDITSSLNLYRTETVNNIVSWNDRSCLRCTISINHRFLTKWLYENQSFLHTSVKILRAHILHTAVKFLAYTSQKSSHSSVKVLADTSSLLGDEAHKTAADSEISGDSVDLHQIIYNLSKENTYQ